jgi:DNA-binding Xre family transcriptional regulator
MIINGDMAINCKLKDVAMMRGYKNAKHLADAMTLYFGKSISYNTIYPLWDNSAENYSRTTLNRLSEFLNTSPGMILEYVPDENAKTVEHPYTSEPTARERRSRSTSAGPKAKTRAAAMIVG